MKIHYLEYVTNDVNALCATFEATHGVSFGEPDAPLGGARTTALHEGGMLGIRAPLSESETPIVRAYTLVDDIEAATAQAADAGAVVALPPTEIQGHGTCAILIQGGVQSGLWQRQA
ncbi:MAG: hydroxylase [Bacteroidota bacterium]